MFNLLCYILRMKKLIFIFIVFFLNILQVFAYQVDIPAANWDISVKSTTVEVSDNSYIGISKLVNEYLWFFLGVVSLWAVIYAWYLLISSNGDSNDMKKANKILIWWVVGIFVALFAYVITKLLVWLF